MAREFHNGTLQNWIDNFVWDCWVPNGEYSITETVQLGWVSDDVNLWRIDQLSQMVDHIRDVSGVELRIPQSNASTLMLKVA
jgi:hypothetical protein